MLEQIYPLVVVALGFGVLGITGFGSALISVPLLAWVWPLQQVVPLVLVIDFVASLVLGGLQWKLIRLRDLLGLFGWILAGVVLGAGVSTIPGVLQSGVLLMGLGLYVAWVGWQGLRGHAAAEGHLFQRPAASGLAGGVIEVLWGTSGPVIVSHLVQRVEDPLVLRAHISLTLMFISGLACVSMGLTGRATSPEVLAWLPQMLGVSLVSMVVAHQWSKRAPVAQVRRAILGLLLVSGLALLVQGLRQFTTT